MESSAYFFDQAQECRRLAATVIERDDPVIAGLLAFAAKFEAAAMAAAIRENDAISEHHPPSLGQQKATDESSSE
jgi:hypothetical protein